MGYRRQWNLVIGLAIVAGLALAVPPSHACSCKPSGDATSALEGAYAVFSGLVVGMTLDTSWVSDDAEQSIDDCRTRMVADGNAVKLCQKGEMVVRLKVFKTWKGDLGEEIEVLTDTQGPACGFNFRIAQVYLVFAGQRPDGRYATSSCSRTALLAKAQEDIGILGDPINDIWPRKAAELGVDAGD